MSQQLDTQGEAHEALGTAVASYGHRVLSDPHTLGNLVADLLPDLPRERSLLVTAAEAGVAAEMRQHVEEQHIDPDTAVQLMARALSERRAIDPAASMWVASEYAQALGYQVRPYTAAVPPGQLSPVAPSAMTATSPPTAEAPTVQVPVQPSWPPAGPRRRACRRNPGPQPGRRRRDRRANSGSRRCRSSPGPRADQRRSPGPRPGRRRSPGHPPGRRRSPGHPPGRPGSPGRRPSRLPAAPRTRGPAGNAG